MQAQATTLHFAHVQACEGCGLCAVKSIPCNNTRKILIYQASLVNLSNMYVPLHGCGIRTCLVEKMEHQEHDSFTLLS